eukprot:SAG31_NODE_1307_length_8887_cov_3.767183_4_plen_326_part_00
MPVPPPPSPPGSSAAPPTPASARKVEEQRRRRQAALAVAQLEEARRELTEVRALFRTQIWDANFPIISNTSGVPVLNSGRRRPSLPRVCARSRRSRRWSQGFQQRGNCSSLRRRRPRRLLLALLEPKVTSTAHSQESAWAGARGLAKWLLTRRRPQFFRFGTQRAHRRTDHFDPNATRVGAPGAPGVGRLHRGRLSGLAPGKLWRQGTLKPQPAKISTDTVARCPRHLCICCRGLHVQRYRRPAPPSDARRTLPRGLDGTVQGHAWREDGECDAIHSCSSHNVPSQWIARLACEWKTPACFLSHESSMHVCFYCPSFPRRSCVSP